MAPEIGYFETSKSLGLRLINRLLLEVLMMSAADISTCNYKSRWLIMGSLGQILAVKEVYRLGQRVVVRLPLVSVQSRGS